MRKGGGGAKGRRSWPYQADLAPDVRRIPVRQHVLVLAPHVEVLPDQDLNQREYFAYFEELVLGCIEADFASKQAFCSISQALQDCGGNALAFPPQRRGKSGTSSFP